MTLMMFCSNSPALSILSAGEQTSYFIHSDALMAVRIFEIFETEPDSFDSIFKIDIGEVS